LLIVRKHLFLKIPLYPPFLKGDNMKVHLNPKRILPTLCYFTLGYEGEDDEPDDDIPRSPWTF
jgi:hypothetical protein